VEPSRTLGQRECDRGDPVVVRPLLAEQCKGLEEESRELLLSGLWGPLRMNELGVRTPEVVVPIEVLLFRLHRCLLIKFVSPD
jgi:hypothetical protein